MEIKEEIGKVIAVRKKAICSNCGTEMNPSSCRQEFEKSGFFVCEKNIYEYTCPKCGAKEESDQLYPNVDFVPIFDDEEKS